MEVVMHNKLGQDKRLVLLIGISLLVHIAFMFTIMPDFSLGKLSSLPEEKPLKIKLVQSDAMKRQIVQTEQSKREKKLNQSKFLSNKTNTFDRETRSMGVGSFKAPAIGSKDARKTVNRVKASAAQKFKDIKLADLGLKKSTNLTKKKTNRKIAKVNAQRKGLKSGKQNGLNLGKTSDFLEDIPLGDFTKLNTQEYEYYGFYHRIRQKLEQFWGVKIQEQAEKMMKSGRSIASDTNLVTGLTIKLNSRGEIVDIILKSTSGIRELDNAAIESFNQAGPFPNPPKGMIKADGKATIEWGFVVNT